LCWNEIPAVEVISTKRNPAPVAGPPAELKARNSVNLEAESPAMPARNDLRFMER
jgi:hypothetical protein